MARNNPDQLILDDSMRPRVNLDARNAFARVPFASYFGVSEAAFEEVTPDAYAVSEPAYLVDRLYRKTDYSMRGKVQGIGWVVLGGAEASVIVDFPEALARRTEARQTQTMRGIIKSQEERKASAVRAGAHALEQRIEPMENLVGEYKVKMSNTRELIHRIPLHWRAHTNEGNMRTIADTVKGGILETMQTLADAYDWSGDELKLAKLGVDKRLMAGRGQQRMDEKKTAWLGLSKLFGNYTRAKYYLALNRLDRSKIEIAKRLEAGRAG